MYNAFFGLSEAPFSLSPDPAFLYRSPQHEEALANLIYGVQSRKGFIVLTGEVGTGKTTLLECLRDLLHSQGTQFAHLFNSRLSPAEFLESIAYDLDLECDRTRKTSILFALNRFLIAEAERGSTVVLIVDEAQNLDRDVLEEVRLLGNLETRRGKLLQIVLSGQPELDSLLESPSLRQLKQRIVLRCQLRPFGPEDTASYIRARLAKAGMENQTVFPLTVIQEIHYATSGIPRLINAVCDNLLLTAFALETKVATDEMLKEVSRDLRLTAERNSAGE